MNIGAGLMFAGGIGAAVWSFETGKGSWEVPLPRAFLILGFILALVLLLSRPLVGVFREFFLKDKESSVQCFEQQNGINLGAVLMFMGTLTAMLIASFERPGNRFPYAVILMTAGFAVLLVIRNVIQIVQILSRRGGGGGGGG